MVSLGLIASDAESCNGVIVRVTAEELAMLDWRERDYERTDVSDGDILQALAMTSAIRGRMLEGDEANIADLNRILNEQAWQAVSTANSYAAARA